MNKLLFLLFVFLFLVFVSSMGYSQVILQNVSQSFDSKTNETTFVFNSTNSALRIGNDNFLNIIPASRNNSAYLKTDSNGSIVGANFSVNEYGGKYRFSVNNSFVSIILPPNSSLVFENGTFNCTLLNGSVVNVSLIKNTSARIYFVPAENASILLPGNLTLENGSIAFFNNSFYVLSGQNLTIGGIGLSAQNSSINLFFNDTNFSKEGIYFINQSYLYANLSNGTFDVNIKTANMSINSNNASILLNMNNKSINLTISGNNFNLDNGTISNGRVSYGNNSFVQSFVDLENERIHLEKEAAELIKENVPQTYEQQKDNLKKLIPKVSKEIQGKIDFFDGFKTEGLSSEMQAKARYLNQNYHAIRARLNDPEITPEKYSQLINFYYGSKNLLSQNQQEFFDKYDSQ